MRSYVEIEIFRFLFDVYMQIDNSNRREANSLWLIATMMIRNFSTEREKEKEKQREKERVRERKMKRFIADK